MSVTTSLVRKARQMITRRIAYRHEQVINKLVLKHNTSDIVLIFLTQLTASTTQPCYDNKTGQNKNIRTN